MKPPTYFRLVLEEPESRVRDFVGMVHLRKDGTWQLRLWIAPDVVVELPIRSVESGDVSRLQRAAMEVMALEEKRKEETRDAVAQGQRTARLRERDERRDEDAARRQADAQAAKGG